MEDKISSWVEENSIYPGLLSYNSRIGESQRLKFSNPVSSALPYLFRYLTGHIFLFNLLLFRRLCKNLSFWSFNPLFHFGYLFFDLPNFCLSVNYSLLNHFVDFFQVTNFLLEFGVSLIFAGLEPFGVNFLLTLEFGERTIWSLSFSTFYFG